MSTSTAAAAAAAEASALALAAERYQLDHYSDNREPAILAACGICIVFIVVPVALRVYAQRMIGKASALDTWMILIAATLAMAITACTIVATHKGLGKHELRVQQEDPHPPSHTLLIFELGYVITILQGATLMFLKLAILVFYRRAFTMRNKAFRLSIMIVGAFSIVLGVAQTIEFILACIPASLFWERVYLALGEAPPHPLSGYCMPQTIHLTIPLILDLVSEVAILVLPAIALWELQLPIRKKVGLFFAFSLGFFVTAISIVRLVQAYKLKNDGDLTWNDADSYLWQTLQVAFGVACACVPAMAPLYRLAKQRAASKGSPSKYYRQVRPTGKHAFGSLNSGFSNHQPDRESTSGLKHSTEPSSSEPDLESGARGYECGSTFQNTIVGKHKDEKAGDNIQMDGINIERDISVTTTA